MALVLVQAHVFYHGGFLAETFAARRALQRKFRFLLVDFAPAETLFSRVFSRFSFPGDMPFDFI